MGTTGPREEEGEEMEPSLQQPHRLPIPNLPSEGSPPGAGWLLARRQAKDAALPGQAGGANRAGGPQGAGGRIRPSAEGTLPA